MGYYLTLFERSPQLCDYYSVNALAINIGMITCLAYASLERNYFIFRKTGVLTWRRQCIPILVVIIYSYILSILMVFIPQCEYIPCSPCHNHDLKYIISLLIVNFIIPELIMFSSTFVLIFRLYRKHATLNQTKERHTFHRIVLQMTFYVVWSCLWYCPPAFYNLALAFESNRFSPPTSSAMIIVSTVSVQSYPLLTFLLMINYRRNTKSIKQTANESKLRLHVLPTITE